LKKRQRGQKRSIHEHVFNAILALYGGEEDDDVFSDLYILFENYPQEIEFYVPQLCTYLLHFGQAGGDGPDPHELEKFLLSKSKRSL